MDRDFDSNTFFRINKKVKQVISPYLGHISAGKNTYVYDAHTYHTKVPPECIETFINYYTDKGDVVLDPFCGSGMTGIAAQRQGRKVLLSDLSPAATFIADNLNSPVDADEYMYAVKTLLEKGKDVERALYSTICRECVKRVNVILWYGVMVPFVHHITMNCNLGCCKR